MTPCNRAVLKRPRVESSESGYRCEYVSKNHDPQWPADGSSVACETSHRRIFGQRVCGGTVLSASTVSAFYPRSVLASLPPSLSWRTAVEAFIQFPPQDPTAGGAFASAGYPVPLLATPMMLSRTEVQQT